AQCLGARWFGAITRNGTATWQIIVGQVLLKSVGYVFARGGIKGGVRNRIVERVRKTDARVVDLSNVCTELNDVLTANPGEIIAEMVDWGHEAQTMQLVRRLKNEPEADVVTKAVSAEGKRLTRQAIVKIVHQVRADVPSMAYRNAVGVIPNTGDGGIWKCFQVRYIRISLMIADVVQADEGILLAVDDRIETGKM